MCVSMKPGKKKEPVGLGMWVCVEGSGEGTGVTMEVIVPSVTKMAVPVRTWRSVGVGVWMKVPV